MKNGVELVGQTGSSLQGIVAQVEMVDQDVSSIVEATQNQVRGLSEISQSVAQVDQTTQQNAAMSEENSAASTHLAREAEVLRDLVCQFKLVRHGTNAPVGLRMVS